MTLQEKIEKLVNKIKHFDMKLGQFEKRLEALEKLEQPEPVTDNAKLDKCYTYLFGNGEDELTQEAEETLEETAEVLEEEEGVTEEILELIDEVTEGE